MELVALTLTFYRSESYSWVCNLYTVEAVYVYHFFFSSLHIVTI